MATKSKRHIHKYYRANLTMGKIWACALPDCNHHMPPHYAELLNGKATMCWGNSPDCYQQFLLDPDSMKDDKPICPGCKLHKQFGRASKPAPEPNPEYKEPAQVTQYSSESNIGECSKCHRVKDLAGSSGICMDCFLEM